MNLKGGHNNEAHAHVVRFGVFHFISSLSGRPDARNKMKNPGALHQGFVVAGAGFEPTAFGL
jgi:hypothetical protein